MTSRLPDVERAVQGQACLGINLLNAPTEHKPRFAKVDRVEFNGADLSEERPGVRPWLFLLLFRLAHSGSFGSGS